MNKKVKCSNTQVIAASLVYFLAFEVLLNSHPTNVRSYKCSNTCKDLFEMHSPPLPYRFSSRCDRRREGNECWEQAGVDWREESHSQTDLLVTEASTNTLVSVCTLSSAPPQCLIAPFKSHPSFSLTFRFEHIDFFLLFFWGVGWGILSSHPVSCLTRCPALSHTARCPITTFWSPFC